MHRFGFPPRLAERGAAAGIADGRRLPRRGALSSFTVTSGKSASAATSGGFVRRLSAPSSFTVCVALRPHFGAAPPDAGQMIDLASSLLHGGRVDTFLLSHQPPGAGDSDTLALAREILRLGGTPLVSVSLANRTRSEALEDPRGLP